MEDLNQFFVKNKLGLDEIQEHINHFNPIKVMGMEHMEIRHSFILRWLLDPRGNHDLKEWFLKEFIKRAFDNDKGGDSDLSLNEIEDDLKNAVVHREWQCKDGAGRIDLLILSPKNNWAVVIENKFYSTQYDGQLRGYIKAIEEEFGSKYKIQGIFLTLWNEKPQDSSYTSIGYEDIHKILSPLFKEEQESKSKQEENKLELKKEVRIFLKHYFNVIGEATDMNTETNDLTKQARDLYRNNKEVLDFIVNSGQGAFITAARNVFGEMKSESEKIGNRSFIYGYLKGNYLGLVPTGWYEALGRDEYKWPGSEKVGGGLGLPIILWIHYFSDGEKIKLYSNINLHTEREIRESFVKFFRDIKEGNPRIESLDEAKEGSNTVKFLPDESEQIVKSHDEEAIGNAMKKILAKFDKEFDAIEEALNNFMPQVKDRLDKRNNDEQ